MNKKAIFLLLVVVGVCLVGIYKLNFYPQLSQGDHGRDLYSAQAVLRGEMPYKDFWWVYGPLMPYYFAVFYKLAGASIVGFLTGDLFLKILAAVFFYLALSRITPPLIAFLGAIFFARSQPDFFFTFNHMAGITCELAILFLLFTFITQKSQRHLSQILPPCGKPAQNDVGKMLGSPRQAVNISSRFLPATLRADFALQNPGLWLTLPVIFIYCLIKINFGLAALCVVLLTALVGRFKDKNFYLSSAAMLGLVALIYWLFLKNLNIEEIRQCMPYFGDDQPHHFPPSLTIPYYFTQHWLTLVHAWLDFSQNISRPMSNGFSIFLAVFSALNILSHILLHLATMLVIWQILSNRIKGDERKNLLWALATLGIFFILNFHEFVVSGVWYRTYWSLPFLFAFHYIMLYFGFRILPVFVRGVFWAIFGLLFIFNAMVGFFQTQQQKTPMNFLTSAYGKIYVGNEPEWTQTVNAVSQFLKDNLKPNETFFALPYDDIYYYLTNKPTPTRMLIFFDHIKILPAQEMSIIKELENHNVAYVLMSNRIVSSERGLGVFGKTYCPLIAAYINEKFMPVARQGGDWQKEPGWGNNHGVLILKRKDI